MLTKIILFACFVTFCRCNCDFNRESGNLACNDVEFSAITKDYLTFKKELLSADLKNCKVTHMASTMVPFDAISKLSMSCGIQTLQYNTFYNLNELTSLDLSNNKIEKYPNDLYRNTQKLHTLDLSFNKLRNPSVDSLYHLNNIKTLKLNDNRIANLDLGSLDVVPKLENLLLNNNEIYGLPLGIFDKVDNLKHLNLENNNIDVIFLGVLDSIPKLEYLNVGTNLIASIPLGLFDKSIELKHFDVSRCRISRFELGVLDAIKKLEVLNINGNAVRTLELGLFDRNSELQSLDISRMKLNELPKGLFDRNNKLKLLIASDNQLTALPQTLFYKTNLLESVNLTNNQISALAPNLFKYTDIKIIDLSYNDLNEIKKDSFNTETLLEFHAQGNKIFQLDPQTFASTNKAIIYMDFRDNRLVYIRPDFFDSHQNLQRFELTGNPWECKCLDQLLQTLSQKSINYSKRNYFKGSKAVCVALNPFDCKVDVNDIGKYYDAFM